MTDREQGDHKATPRVGRIDIRVPGRFDLRWKIFRLLTQTERLARPHHLGRQLRQMADLPGTTINAVQSTDGRDSR